MVTVNEDLIKGKKVILRLDLDIPLKEGVVIDDFRLKAALPAVELVLKNAERVLLIGHLGRPQGVDLAFSLKPVADWFLKNLPQPPTFITDLNSLDQVNFALLENLRFDPGEEKSDLEFAKKLASGFDFFINEAFAAHHKAASTTVLPTLLPHAAGLRFAKEVKTLLNVRNNPQRPSVAIIGGAKVEDKYPAVIALSKLYDAVLVGGLLAQKIKEQNLPVKSNVMVGKLNDSGIDLAEETIEAFSGVLKNAKQAVWGGPLGKYEDPAGNRADLKLAQVIVESGAKSIIGGGDTQAALKDFLDKFSFISVGGGAMLEFLSKGTLPTIQALQ